MHAPSRSNPMLGLGGRYFYFQQMHCPITTESIWQATGRSSTDAGGIGQLKICQKYLPTYTLLKYDVYQNMAAGSSLDFRGLYV